MITAMHILGFIILLLTALFFKVKCEIAYDNCSGGAPLLDALVLVPLMALIGASFVGNGTLTLVLGLGSILFCPLCFWGLWKLGKRKREQKNREVKP